MSIKSAKLQQENKHLKEFYKDVRHLYFNSTHNDLSIEVLECLLDEIGKLIETAHKQGLNSNE